MKEAIIAAEVMGIIISIIIFYSGYFESKNHNEILRAFHFVVLTNLVAMTADMFSWIVDGNPQQENIAFVFTLLSTVLCFAVSVAFLWYMYLYISSNMEISIVPFVCAILFSMLSMLVVTIACLHGYIIHFDKGVYSDGKFYEIYLLLNAVSLVFVFIILISSVKRLGLHDSVAALSYIIIPLISMALNAFNEELSVTYPAITISLLIVHVMLQAENENNLIKRELFRTHQVMHDDMTGLQNRRAFIDNVEFLGRQEVSVGVIFGDINGLKYTNDNYGHVEGDKLICSFADMLKTCFRKNEAFRISGDEFMVLLPGITREVLNTRIEALSKLIRKDDVPIASIGFDFGNTCNLNDLLKSAEINMYQEKKRFYSEHPDFRR